MRRAIRSQPGAVPKLATIAGACAALAAAAAVACITAPPPDLPSLPPQRPTAIHQAVVPPEGLILEWPAPPDYQFSVPVQVAAAGDSFVYSVFLDSMRIGEGTGSPNAPDGGITIVPFPAAPPDTSTCPHQLEFIVARGWANAQRGIPDAVGADVVRWTYANGGGPQGCPPLDAGTGAFPDAAVGGLSVPPEAGGDP